jgi:CRISPR-associated protein Csb2
MALVIEQRFPLGRFHGTRWNQGAFGDAYGEWPPSPWRLLRALAMRWFQYARETGDGETTTRDDLLLSLASSLPAYSLPASTWRGPALKQYQPTALEDHYKYRRDSVTRKQVIDYSYRQVTTTLVEDHYRALPPDEPVFWCWEDLDVPVPQEQLLDRLLDRMLYFGRAESFSRLRRAATLPPGVEINCRLEKRDADAMMPVLVHLPGRPLSLAVLLAASDDKELKGRSIPPGTAWYYAQVPRQPVSSAPTATDTRHPDTLFYLQFAVGGRVLPPLRRWVKVAERFRGRVVRRFAQTIAPDSQGRYNLLTPIQKNELALICGKDAGGQPLRGHRHAFFLPCPDKDGLPTRFIVWRSSPFTADEVEALLAASEHPISWDDRTPEWRVQLVPIPSTTPVPAGLLTESFVWESATPFVPPAERHRFRKNGRPRPGESLERIVTKLLQARGKPAPAHVAQIQHRHELTWVALHETRSRRLARIDSRTPWARPGFWLRLEFETPVSGPLVLGDSCHFGLGLFVAK